MSIINTANLSGIVYPPVPSMFTHPADVTLECGKVIHYEGLPEDLDVANFVNLQKVLDNVDSAKKKYSQKHLHQFAKSGDAEKLICALAENLDPNHYDSAGTTALHLAAERGHLLCLHLLHQAGGQLDVLDKDLSTPLMLAANAAQNNVVKYLVKLGAAIENVDEEGMTCLHIAARGGNLEACHYILSCVRSRSNLVNIADDGGWTPLVWACDNRKVEVVKCLLARGADPKLRDVEQNIALHWSSFSGSLEISELLLNAGCDTNSVNAHGDTPLHIAARRDNPECLILFLSTGARLEVKNTAGVTPLQCCPGGDSQTYQILKLNHDLCSLMNNSEPRLRILTNDISGGREQNPIQCINEIDDEGLPTDYLYINQNCETKQINMQNTITSLQSCSCRNSCSGNECLCSMISMKCWYDEEGKLLPEFNFADPPMIFECNRACRCNYLTCNNRVVQHRVMARMILFRTPDKGWGVRVLKPIQRGTYVCEYIGEIITDHEADRREDDSYLFDLDNRDVETYCIDARIYGNVARFINHSCDPNLVPVKVFIDHQDLRFPRIAFFAQRDIAVGEELGFDYGEKFWIIKYKAFTCSCGAEKCKYSETTIQYTLEKYRQKLLDENRDGITPEPVKKEVPPV